MIRAFFAEAGADIGALMQQAGVRNEPQPVFSRPLDTPDRSRSPPIPSGAG